MAYIRSSKRIVAILFLLLTDFSLAQSDSVTSSRHKGSSRVKFGNPLPPENIAPNPETTYLLKGVRMASTGERCAREIVLFGPFTNHSSASLTITLNHIGGSSHRSSSSVVDGVPIARTEGGSQSFLVPPRSTYQWWAENDHTISASTSSTINNPRTFGLPSAQDFVNPVRTGQYKGCRHFYNESDEADKYAVAYTEYYFTISPMTDSSDCWNEFIKTSEFGNVVLGPAPQDPGLCLDTRTRPPPAPTGD